MKKILCASLALLMAAGCSSSAATGNSDSSKSEDLYYVFTSDLKTLDYMRSQNASDHEINENLVDGLTEVNNVNQYVGALAKDWEHNDDYTEWTFNLRDNATWVTNAGEEYAPVTAEDFETGLQHCADFDGPTLYLANMFVKNLAEYKAGTAKWDDVGVEAVDDSTVKYTLKEPTPYFASVVSYTPFYPMNKDFLEEQGSGCKLGLENADPNTCNFGQPTDPSSILYNGGYILDEFVSKSSEKMHKNEAYWDADNVHINNISLVYDDGSDPASTVKGFEQSENPYYQATLLTTSADFQSYLDKYKENAYTGQQNQYTFGINFNLNRITYNYTDKNEAQQEDTRKALLNANFRKAMKYGMDRQSYLETTVDASIAGNGLRNIECPWIFVATSDGKSYGELVQEASEDPDTDLTEGQDAYYDPDKAKEYMEKAKAELTDVSSWPIKLDLMVQDSDASSVAMGSSLEQSIEQSVGAENIDIVNHPVDEDTYANSAYNSTGPQDADWDISTSTGWGYDYIDPKTYLNIFSPVDGDILRQNMGLNFYKSNGFTTKVFETINPNITEEEVAALNARNDAAIEQSGLMDYQDLLDKAYAITDDMDARYKAEAAAEAYLLDEALFIPVNTQLGSVNWRISRQVPFTNGYLSVKYKWRVIQKDPVTAEEYQTAYEQWQKDVAEAAEKAAA
jgi:oligopeptide transport system substrate-binding protein